MRQIDLEKSPRRDHFNYFRNWDYPHFNMCANVDITSFYPAIKAYGTTFTIGLIYVITRAANDIPQFRQRIHGENLVEHPVVHAGCTIMREDESFTFCYIHYDEDFGAFSTQAAREIEKVQVEPRLEDQETDNGLYMTAIPWVSFTSFLHPMHLSPADSVPRFAWGKFFKDDARWLLPFSVQGHHAVMDGLHMGRYYARVQDYLHHPERFTGS